MSTETRPRVRENIEYPDSDGQPMAENTVQFRWIVTIQGGLDALFRDEPNVFVAGDLLWYPVEGNNTLRMAPDALVVFGRPKGDRGSYRQWEEDGIAPQVVFEVLSPGNRLGEMNRKFQFYEQFGVEEYYVYDPDDRYVEGWRRVGEKFQQIPDMNGWVSPRLGIRFDRSSGDLRMIGSDGEPFVTYVELKRERIQESQRADAEQQRADAEQQRADRLAEQLRKAGIEPEL